MKATEAVRAISMLEALTERIEARATFARSTLAAIHAAIDADPGSIVAGGERAATILDEENGSDEATAPFAAIVKEVERDMAEPAPYGRRADGSPKAKPGKKARAMDGRTLARAILEAPGAQPVPVDLTGGKAHVAPLTSPLTPELREKLERTLGAAPMTCEALARMSWAVDLDAARIEALLCEAPDTFIRWQRPDSRDPRLGEDVWGLPHQFDRAVSTLVLQGAKSDRPKSTVVALGCSEPAAIAAWKRLDQEKAS